MAPPLRYHPTHTIGDDDQEEVYDLSGYGDASTSRAAEESEALILKRLGTDPAPRGASRASPSKKSNEHSAGEVEFSYSDEENVEDLENQTDEGLEKRRMRSLAKRQREEAAIAVSEEKVGRPTWFVRILGGISRLRLWMKIVLGLGAGMALFGLFMFAFGGSGNSTAQKVWSWGGDIWYTSGSGSSSKTPPSSFPSPDEVGYPGPTQAGKPAELSEEDKLHASDGRVLGWNGLPVETRLPEGIYEKGFNPFDHMGPLTPWRPSSGWGVDDAQYRALPDDCSLEQVHYLSRHGSRYPTSGSPAHNIADLLSQKPKPTFTGPLSFLNTYEYRLGKELLVPLGRQQLYDEGAAAVIAYGQMIHSDIAKYGSIFVRTGSQHRIVESAENWLAGALGLKWPSQVSLEVQIEAEKFNTTLAPNFACKNAGAGDPKLEPAVKWMRDWIEEYARAASERLKPHMSGADMTPSLVNSLQQLCSYDTVAGYAAAATTLCPLFTQDEWLGLEYFWDLQFYGLYGSGSALGPAQGVGWVNEFLSRLQSKPWDISTQTSENSTFNLYPSTFPVEPDRRFYADFTHDSTIANVLSALNLGGFNKPLPLTGKPDPKRLYRTSEMVPFAARAVFEKIKCSGSGSGSGSSQGSTDAKDQEFLRLVLNDRIYPLSDPDVGAPGCSRAGKRDDGMCPLEDFVRGLDDRMQRVKWENCFLPLST